MEWSLNVLRKIPGMIRGFNCFTSFLVLLFFLLGCKNDNRKGAFLYYYYPAKNVYYDSAKRVFWYSLNGGKSWSAYNNRNNFQPATLGQKIQIYSDDTEVFKDNDSHRKTYSGKMYALNIAKIDSAAGDPEVRERVVVKKKEANSKKAINNKPKKGIAKFINKIFGKGNQ